MKIITVRSYSHPDAREIANRIKNATDDEALQRAAEEMAQHVPSGAVLVPAPSSSGQNKSMAVLAEYIADIVPGTEVMGLVRRIHRMPSKVMLRRAGKPLPSFAQQVASMALAGQVPPDRELWIVDNVVTSGDTLRAMEHHLGRKANAIVWADASRYRRPRGNPPQGRVCISGSRGYRHPDRVISVVKTFPRDILIVHGGAEGVDRWAQEAADQLGIETETWRPDWAAHGRAAGPMRNRAMVESCDYLYAFWDGVSRGTASAIQAAIDSDVPFDVILDDEP